MDSIGGLCDTSATVGTVARDARVGRIEEAGADTDMDGVIVVVFLLLLLLPQLLVQKVIFLTTGFPVSDCRSPVLNRPVPSLGVFRAV